jgi:hypothetical protein
MKMPVKIVKIKFTKDIDIWGIIFKKGEVREFPIWLADYIIKYWNCAEIINEKEEKNK